MSRIKLDGMKYLLISLFVFPYLVLHAHNEEDHGAMTGYADTGHIAHVLDGLTNEWPASDFHLSDDSTIEYALDNDDKNLYIVMTIPDFGEQMKIMRNGMKIFIDLKGKKKEGKGVEFPIQGEAGSSGLSSPNFASKDASEEQSKKLDKKTARSILSLAIVAYRLFGFGGNEKDDQGLMTPGSVNIAYKWDESDQMHIEYNIPLELLGKSSSLDKKELSIGWKINGFDRPEGLHNSENAGNGEGGGYQRGAHAGGSGHEGVNMVVEAAGA